MQWKSCYHGYQTFLNEKCNTNVHYFLEKIYLALCKKIDNPYAYLKDLFLLFFQGIIGLCQPEIGKSSSERLHKLILNQYQQPIPESHVRLSFSLSVRLFVCPSICLCISLFVHLSFCLSQFILGKHNNYKHVI